MMNMEHYVTGVAMVIKVENNLRPRNKGRKPASLAGSLTCKHNDAEDAEFAAGGDMPAVSAGGIEPRQTACEPASRGRGGVVKHEVSCDMRLEIPAPQYLAKSIVTSASRS
jgi:hypothetical protein